MNKLFLSKMILLVAIPLIALAFWNCEKDDICDPGTPTTPRLIIGFYDIIESDEPKAVTRLAVIAENFPGADTIKVPSTDFPNSIELPLPLDITQNSVRYKLILNQGDANPLLIYTDILEFNYSRTTTFVSRACGYKNTFTLNNEIGLPAPFVLNDNPMVVPGAWIKNISVENFIIDNETEQHVKIFF